jgi:hypothetical protein
MRFAYLIPLLLALPALAGPDDPNPFTAMFAPPQATPPEQPKAQPKPAESVPPTREFTTTYDPETGAMTTAPGRPANFPDGPARKPPPPFQANPEPTAAPAAPSLMFETPGVYLIRIKVGKATGAAIVQVPEAGTFPVVVEATKR